MSCAGNCSDSVYTKYVNPVYVTAISTPAAAHRLLPLSSSNSPSTFRLGADCTSQVSSARSRRRRTEFPYVVRKTVISGHRPASVSGVNRVIKSLQKLRFSRLSDAVVSEPRTVILQSPAADGGVLDGECSRPSSHDDLETSGSSLDLEMSVLNVAETDSSVANDEKSFA